MLGFRRDSRDLSADSRSQRRKNSAIPEFKYIQASLIFLRRSPLGNYLHFAIFVALRDAKPQQQ